MAFTSVVGAKVLAAGVCPTAPPGMAVYQDQVTGWVKWGVLAMIGVAALVSIGSILVGRIFSHPHASRTGAMGLGITVICAMLYVTILGILTGITGSGCS
jgi:bacteriorhodopsin